MYLQPVSSAIGLSRQACPFFFSQLEKRFGKREEAREEEEEQKDVGEWFSSSVTIFETRARR